MYIVQTVTVIEHSKKYSVRLICHDPIIELAGLLWAQSLFVLTAIASEPGLANVY